MAPAKGYLRGILLSITTALLWGVLPIFLKITLQGFHAGTISWFRFLFAFLILAVILQWKNHKPLNILLNPPWMGIVGGACLSANYYWVTVGVDLSGPSNMAVLIQTASVFLVLVGVFVFRELLTLRQVLGMVVAGSGLFLFFHDQQSRIQDAGEYYYANFLIVLAALVWVGYMVSQKFLSRQYGAQSLNLLVYGVATFTLIGGVEWADFTNAGLTPWLSLIFCAVNTLLAYGTLAEAVKYIPLALISVIISLNPLITLLGMKILPEIGFAGLQADPVGSLGYFGGAIAVTGVVLVVYRPTRRGANEQ
ncbi:MAG: DMT family transporter [Nitrospina sp.]|nr:DMT family transporter [Nitrospina sp.]MBT3509817.1 DMT family transporter [Nitrospina sp.]MBT3876207.1 DMT family transporter [Nitrospina sp.]MBT4049815.1 DMT family transporter [Nitrospina sp.]MBT4558703.1 DMT family transporter [Nitrospina sp.]